MTPVIFWTRARIDLRIHETKPLIPPPPNVCPTCSPNRRFKTAFPGVNLLCMPAVQALGEKSNIAGPTVRRARTDQVVPQAPRSTLLPVHPSRPRHASPTALLALILMPSHVLSLGLTSR